MTEVPPKDEKAHHGDKGDGKGIKAGTQVVAEAEAGKADLTKQVRLQSDLLKAGGRSGITNEFGKPAFVDTKPHVKDAEDKRTHTGDKPPALKPTTKTGEIRATYAEMRANIKKDGHEVSQTFIAPYEEWQLNLKPGHTTKSPDGGTVHADDKGRIDWITDVKDRKTTIQYVGDSTQPQTIKIGDGPTLTWHGKEYGIAGQEGQVDAVLDQNTGIIRWSNKYHEETRHFPCGGTENQDQHGRVTAIIDAYGQRTDFKYDEKHDYPVHITAGFDTGKPIREFDLADGKTPTYYYSGDEAFGGGNKIGIVADRHTGAIYTLSMPGNHDITNLQEMNTLKKISINGQSETKFDGDQNFIPEPIRILMGAVKI